MKTDARGADRSEVVELIRQIDLEYEAVTRAVMEEAESVVRQGRLTTRLAHLALLHEQLEAVVGKREANRLVLDRVFQHDLASQRRGNTMDTITQAERIAPCSRLFFLIPRQAAGPLAEDRTQAGFVLHGKSIQCGDALAVRLFDIWVSGCVDRDHRGWFLLTGNRVGIRLTAGLTACRRSAPRKPGSPA